MGCLKPGVAFHQATHVAPSGEFIKLSEVQGDVGNPTPESKALAASSKGRVSSQKTNATSTAWVYQWICKNLIGVMEGTPECASFLDGVPGLITCRCWCGTLTEGDAALLLRRYPSGLGA